MLCASSGVALWTSVRETYVVFAWLRQIIMAKQAGGPKPRAGDAGGDDD